MLRKFIYGLAFAGGLALSAFMAVGPAIAQQGPLCSTFGSAPGDLDGWGPCTAAPNIVVTTTNVGSIGGASDYYLHLRDTAGASAACSTNQKYLGNWNQKMGDCGQFCFDFKVFVSGSPPGPITPSFTIWAGPTARATFVANFTVTSNDPWRQHICAPVNLAASPPSNSQGHWVVSGGTWNSIITGVTMMQLPIDWTSDPNEEAGYDNLCMNPQTCNPPPPVIDGCLKDSKVTVTCNPDGTYTVTLSGTGFTGTTITMTSQTAGVTVTPPQQPWSATTTWIITGATPGQTVVLTANATKVGGGTTPGADECCSGQITIVMPDCPKPPVGEVVVEKKVKNNTRASASVINSLVFPIGLSCTAPSNLNVSFGLNNGGTHTENNVAYTSVCTVTEPLSTLPAVPKDVCGEGSTAVWATPVITPASATINAPVTAFTVVNELDCAKGGSLIVTKEAVYNGPILLPSQTYPVTVTCGGTVTNLGLVPGVPQTVSNIPINTSCTVVEGTVPTPPNVCPPNFNPAWTTSYVPPSPIIVTGPGATMLITNVLTCERGGQVAVQKVIDNRTTADLTGASFPAVVTCGNVHTNLTLTLPGPQVVHNVPVGTVCSVAETQPPAPTTGCPAGSVPAWMLPSYTPATTTVVAGSGAVLNVLNVLYCKPQEIAPTLVCDPRSTTPKGNMCACRYEGMENTSPTVCMCKDGRLEPGKGCVPRIDCRPPLVPNATGTNCICPNGEVLRRGKCVEVKPPKRETKCPRGQIRKNGECVKREEPRIRGRDVIRGIDLIPHPGGGGGGSQGGGATPGKR